MTEGRPTGGDGRNGISWGGRGRAAWTASAGGGAGEAAASRFQPFQNELLDVEFALPYRGLLPAYKAALDTASTVLVLGLVICMSTYIFVRMIAGVKEELRQKQQKI